MRDRQVSPGTAIVLDGSRLGSVGWDEIYPRHDGLRRFFRNWHESLDVAYDFDELIDAGDRVVAVVTRRGRGKRSGAAVEMHVALVWLHAVQDASIVTVRDGKIVGVVERLKSHHLRLRTATRAGRSRRVPVRGL